MFVFHGGFTLEQVEKIKNDEFIIFDKIPYQQIFIPNKNTFDYYPSDIAFSDYRSMLKYVSDDIYQNQYIFFFKYLRNALDFCVNSDKKNYILVADIDEDILDNYIGIGRYTDNQIEYRVPRCILSKDNIIDFLYFEPFVTEQAMTFKTQFGEAYYNPKEDEEANEVLKVKKLTFNEYKRI